MSGVKCASCETELDEMVGLPIEDRSPCPKCGSLNRLYALSLKGEITPKSSLRARARRKGIRKWFKEIITGADWSYRLRRFVGKTRIIDREIDDYEEKVVDPITGKVIHRCKEPLSKHTEHGSTKKKSP